MRCVKMDFSTIHQIYPNGYQVETSKKKNARKLHWLIGRSLQRLHISRSLGRKAVHGCPSVISLVEKNTSLARCLARSCKTMHFSGRFLARFSQDLARHLARFLQDLHVLVKILQEFCKNCIFFNQGFQFGSYENNDAINRNS